MTIIEQITAGLAPNTKKTAESLIRNHLLPNLQTTRELGGLIELWRDSGLKGRSILKLISLYRSWHLVANGTVPDTRRWARIVSRTVERDERIWTCEQCQRALNESFHIARPLYERMFFTMNTGVRLAEMFQITVEDVRFDRHVVFVYKTIHGGTKSGKPRVVPISEEVESMLRTVIERRGLGAKDCLFEFCDTTEALQQFCRVTGLPLISWHTLRDIYATVLLDSGTSPRQVADLLGHANVSTTVNQYWRNMRNEVNVGVLPCR